MSLVGLEGGGTTRLGRYAHYLRSILPHADVTLTVMTAKAIGQLALAEGTYTAEYVEFEMKRALEWIAGNEHKKLAAVSLLLHLLYYVCLSVCSCLCVVLCAVCCVCVCVCVCVCDNHIVFVT